MRVEDGYRPKRKFSCTLMAETYDRLVAICRKEGCHMTSFIEVAVQRLLEDKGSIRSRVQPIKSRKRTSGKQDLRLLARKSMPRSA